MERKPEQIVQTTYDRIKQARHTTEDEEKPSAKKRKRTIRRFAKRNRHVVALVATILAAFLLGANYLMVRSASTANNIAQDTLNAQERPWVSIRVLEIGPLVKQGDRRKAEMKIEVTNYGKTPAVSMSLTGRFMPVNLDWPDEVTSVKDPAKNPRFERPFVQNILFPGETEIFDHTAFVLEKEIDEWISKNQSEDGIYLLALYVGVPYWPALADEMLYTYRTYAIATKSERGRAAALRKSNESEWIWYFPESYVAK